MFLSLSLGGIFFASLVERTAYEVHRESTKVMAYIVLHSVRDLSLTVINGQSKHGTVSHTPSPPLFTVSG